MLAARRLFLSTTTRSSLATFSTTVDSIANMTLNQEGTESTTSIINTKKSNDTAVTDNPCWGSPSACSLTHLLKYLQQQQCDIVLHRSSDYYALNKPPDVRMDGPHQATFLKLLLYLCPTQHLQEEFPSSSDTSINTPLAQYLQDHVHTFNDIPSKDATDNHTPQETTISTKGTRANDPVSPRPCHQLDYATSGIVLVARSVAAANRARLMFEERRVKKVYLALVMGNVDGKRMPETQVNVVKWLALTEEAFRRGRKKRRNDTFDGFLPPHSMYNKWKKVKSGNASNKKKHPKKEDRSNDRLLDTVDWEKVWKPIEQALNEQAVSEETIYSISWKDLRSDYRTIQTAFAEAATLYNDTVRTKRATATETNSNTTTQLPTFFRPGSDDKDFFIHAPLADHPTAAFHMLLPPQLTDQAKEAGLHVGDDTLTYKPSLTKGTIVGHGTINGQPVTKVMLEPWTGRRHQLRVHMALLGHPIVGDMTYQKTTLGRDKKDRFDVNRMCLHSWRLTVDDESIDVSSPDPFPLDNGVIQIF